VAEIGLATGAGMIAMGMGDHRFFNRLPGIYVEFAWLAVETFICKGY
jgi:hypothetical protein